MEENNVTYFAKTNFRGKDRMFGVRRLDRRQHMYVIGQTGTGKSTFLKNMALQDIKAGHGLCIVDPHGEFVEDVLGMIPPNRMEDVIYFNPADSDYPLGFNVLELPNLENANQYKPLAASSLMGIFTKIWANVWSARMEYILNNAVLALLDSPGETLLGIQRILVDKQYRKKILSNVKDPIVRAFWEGEYEGYDPKFRNEAIAPIQNKVGQFLSSSVVRNIVGQPQSTFNLYEIMNGKKILLANVSKGRIGEDNSQLLGAMIITKLQLAAMERVRIPEHLREDFYLYVDEFQNFATDSFASILSEARKYRLNLLIAHQYIGQLVTDTSTKVRDAVFGNVGTMVVFRVGATDGEFLEKEFAPELTIEDLVGLPNHNIFVKLMINNVRSRPFSAATLPPLTIEVEEGGVVKIVESSRKIYANPKDVVEQAIQDWSKPIIPEGSVLGGPPGSSSRSGHLGLPASPRQLGQGIQHHAIREVVQPHVPASAPHPPGAVPHHVNHSHNPVSRQERPVRPAVPAFIPQSTIPPPSIREGRFVTKEEAAPSPASKSISLSTLAPKGSHLPPKPAYGNPLRRPDPQKQPTSISSLQSVLKDALSKSPRNFSHPKHITPPPIRPKPASAASSSRPSLMPEKEPIKLKELKENKPSAAWEPGKPIKL